MKNRLRRIALAVLTAAVLLGPAVRPAAADEAPAARPARLTFHKGDRVVFVGGTFAEREGLFGYIETLLQARFPDLGLTFRSLPWGLTGHVEYPNVHPNMKVFTAVVRPTCGCEIVSSRHFPPEAQGNFLVPNDIGFQGIKQHKIIEEGSGFTSKELEPPAVTAGPARPFVRNWAFADLTGDLNKLGKGRSFRRGKELFTAATCVQCHRLGKEGCNVGPDLAEIRQKLADPAKKYARADLLYDVLEPSKVINEKYRSWIITTTKGELVTGVIVSQEGKKLTVVANPRAPPLVLDADDIDTKEPAKVSMMPQGLLATLDREEVLDLLAYVASGGDPGAPAWKE